MFFGGDRPLAHRSSTFAPLTSRHSPGRSALNFPGAKSTGCGILPPVPNPDPSDIPRPIFSRRPEFTAPLAEQQPQPRTESFHPQYVSVHSLREHGHGPRNLAWGVVTLLLAVALMGIALFTVGTRALVSLAVCLLTFTALFVLARMHVFRQRNGGFLALGIVCLFGAAMPLVELGYGSIETFLRNRPAATAPASRAGSTASDAPALSLTEAFALTPPDPKAGARVRVIKDAHVAIEGKSYLAKAGDVFAFAARSGRDVTIAARDLLVTLPGDAVEVLDEKTAAPAAASAPALEPAIARTARADEASAAPNETPAQTTDRALHEIVRRYPALGVKGSLENQMFVSMVNELRQSGGEDFFKNPEWPAEIAELLAKREHWRPGAPPATVGPMSLDDAPTPPR